LVVTVISLPETYPPVILSRLAKRLRQETGDDSIVSSLEVAAMEAKQKKKLARVKAEGYRLFAMPFVLLFTELISTFLLSHHVVTGTFTHTSRPLSRVAYGLHEYGLRVRMSFLSSFLVAGLRFLIRYCLCRLIYLLFEGYPIIFTDIHHLPPGYSSLPFLSTFVGAILSGEFPFAPASTTA
jgi:hypothetical protein